MKKIKIKVEIEQEEEADTDNYDYPSFDCPKCEKGLVTIGAVSKITFPKGILAGDNQGEQRFYHYTCDRCDFKILVQNEEDIKRKIIE